MKRKKVKRSPKKTYNTQKKRKTITAPQAQAIRNLADGLGKLLSLEGYKSSFSLTTIAKKKGLTNYLPKNSANKKEAFSEFLKKIYCHKPRTIKILVREILPTAIEKRHAKGDPVLEDEALELSEKLKAIGVDLHLEILAMNLPKERPKVVPPPISIQKILDTFILHSALLPDCKTMFNDGHINEAVRKALERFEKRVQDISGIHDKQGSDLMAHVFSEQLPKIQFNALSNPQEVSKQTGFKFLCMGIMHWWRNNLSHGDEDQIPHHDALGRLILVSNILHELDARLN
ncbi:MAG: TIGR02391 family protein [bacterium]|nr:TIGR02391 family protein [bacterium]